MSHRVTPDEPFASGARKGATFAFQYDVQSRPGQGAGIGAPPAGTSRIQSVVRPEDREQPERRLPPVHQVAP